MEEEEFLLAILQGKTHKVTRMLKSRPSLANIYGGEPLKLSVAYNRRYLTRQLIAHGADPKICEANGTSLILVAARSGFTAILDDLLRIEHEHCQEKAVLEAVERGLSSSIETLARAGVNVSFGEEQAMFRAHELRLYHVIKVLVHHGANVDARDGQLLIDVCLRGEYQENLDFLTYLLDQGCDPNLQEGQALRISVREHYSRILEILLNHGGDERHLASLNLSYSVRETLQRWRRQNRFVRLKRAISSSFNRDTFQWQAMCRKLGNSNVHLVRRQAKIFKLDKCADVSLSKASKRKMCAMLADVCEPMMQKDASMEGTDLVGNSLSDHPAWKLYHLNGITFNILDLLKLIQENYSKPLCPYTRLPLPVEDIRRRGAYLEQVLTRDTLNEFNLIEQVREMPLLTKEMELQTLLMNKVWLRLSYPPNVRIVIYGDEEIIDDMTRKLYKLTDDSQLYPMLTAWRKYDIINATGFRKRQLFVSTLVDIVSANDDYTSVRVNTLSILASHYRDDGTNRSGEQGDLLSFMLDEEEDGDEDDTPSILSIFDRISLPRSVFPSLPPLPEESDEDDGGGEGGNGAFP